MSNNKLTFNEAKQIPITEFLAQQGVHPTNSSRHEYWYLSPFRHERTPSLKVDSNKNVWFDHGTGEGGTIVDLCAKLHQCNLHEALERLSEGGGKVVADLGKVREPPRQGEHFNQAPNRLNVAAVRDLTNPNLLYYLTSRGISTDLAQAHCKEVLLQIGFKRYQTVGFQNRSGGWELRNSWFKGSSSPKDITLLESGSPRLCVLEGFIDFLSLKQSSNADLQSIRKDAGFLILNSLAFVNKSLPLIQHANEVVVFLDNDEAGNQAKETLIRNGVHYYDAATIYSQHKDLNDFHVANEKPNLTVADPGRKKSLGL